MDYYLYFDENDRSIFIKIKNFNKIDIYVLVK